MPPSNPQTTAGLQAKVRLRSAWFEAHPNQPIPEGRAEVEVLFAAIEAEAVEAERERLLHMEPRVLARLAWELDHPTAVWCGCGHRWAHHGSKGCEAETGNHVYDVWCRCVALAPETPEEPR